MRTSGFRGKWVSGQESLWPPSFALVMSLSEIRVLDEKGDRMASIDVTPAYTLHVSLISSVIRDIIWRQVTSLVPRRETQKELSGMEIRIQACVLSP